MSSMDEEDFYGPDDEDVAHNHLFKVRHNALANIIVTLEPTKMSRPLKIKFYDDIKPDLAALLTEHCGPAQFRTVEIGHSTRVEIFWMSDKGLDALLKDVPFTFKVDGGGIPSPGDPELRHTDVVFY